VGSARYVNAHRKEVQRKARERERRKRAADPELARQKDRSSYAKHIERKRAESRASHARHVTQRRAQQRKWREANRAKRAIYNREWRESNPAVAAALSKAWREAHPDKAQARAWRSGANYRARKYRAFIERVERDVIFRRDNGRCYLCGDLIRETEKWHADHVIPLAKGGTHCYENLRVTHARCNKKKHTNIPKGQPTLFQVIAS